MKILVCGDRNWEDSHTLYEVLDEWRQLAFHYGYSTITLIHGNAEGADRMASEWAEEYPDVSVVPFPADWETFGTKAGPIRNKRMLKEYPDLIVAFHDRIMGSKGTKDMVNQANIAGVEVHIYASNGDINEENPVVLL